MSKNFWETERIRLRGVEPEDWEVHYHWNMDSDMQRDLSQLQFPENKALAKKWAEESSIKTPDSDNFHMEIELNETKEVIGMIAAHHADRRNGTFKFGIAIRQEFQRKGFATEAIVLLLRYFFNELRYQKCHVDIHGWNEDSIRLHEKLGFQKEGQVRRANYAMGKYYDRYIYGITLEEFRELYD